MGDAGEELFVMSVAALGLFAFTYITRWFSFATQSYMLAIEKPAAGLHYLGMYRAGLSCHLNRCFLAAGLTGIWLNFAGTALLAAITRAYCTAKVSP